jgi:hypothetical protein
MESSNYSKESLIPKIVTIMLEQKLCPERGNFLKTAIEKFESIEDERKNPEQIYNFLSDLQSAFVIDGIDDLDDLS